MQLLRQNIRIDKKHTERFKLKPVKRGFSSTVAARKQPELFLFSQARFHST